MQPCSIIILSLCVTKIVAIDPFIGGSLAIGGLGAASYYWKDVKDKVSGHFCLQECCQKSSKKWIDFEPNFDDIKDHIFGQHLALQSMPKLILKHLHDENPPKALVISMHGYTGVGKNHMSELLAQRIYKQYRDTGSSKFVVKIIATHFLTTAKSPGEIVNMVDQYLKNCDRTMFIFDEIDKFPEGYLDILLPFLNHNSPRYQSRAIYLFLGNSGGSEINTEVNRLQIEGRPRDEIKFTDLSKIVAQAAHRKGGLKNSELISRGIIDLFVPFLPLEREHVEKCIVKSLKYKYPNPYDIPGKAKINEILDEIEFTEKYSTYGCRRVETLVEIMI